MAHPKSFNESLIQILTRFPDSEPVYYYRGKNDAVVWEWNCCWELAAADENDCAPGGFQL